MSDYVRFPIGFVLRIKYESAEWSPQGNKLILKPPFTLYDEADPANSQQTITEGIFMMDKSDVKYSITNPIRIQQDWGERTPEGQPNNPPITTHHGPLDGFTPVEPTQSKGKGGGGEKRYRPWTPKQLEDCYNYWLLFMEGKYGSLNVGEPGKLEAIAYAVDGMVEISSMACKPEDFASVPAGNVHEMVVTGSGTLPPHPDLPPPPEEAPPVSDQDIPF